nr:hypothetical protein [Streptomyces sp. ISL-1]
MAAPGPPPHGAGGVAQAASTTWSDTVLVSYAQISRASVCASSSLSPDTHRFHSAIWRGHFPAHTGPPIIRTGRPGSPYRFEHRRNAATPPTGPPAAAEVRGVGGVESAGPLSQCVPQELDVGGRGHGEHRLPGGEPLLGERHGHRQEFLVFAVQAGRQAW